MTVGVYALYWEEQDLIYIGESDNIERRFKEHIKMLQTKKHFNHKVQDTYNRYGVPTNYLLEKCLISELKIKEVDWYKEFNNTLNIAPPGNIVTGLKTRHSKYSKFKILRVFSLLYRSAKTHKEIANKVCIPRSVVSAIAIGSRHSWLSEEYPEEYYKMITGRDEINKSNHTSILKNMSSLRKFSKEYPTVVSPIGEVFSFTNISIFCRSHPELSLNIKNSSSGIDKIVRGIRKQYKGWKLHQS